MGLKIVKGLTDDRTTANEGKQNKGKMEKWKNGKSVFGENAHVTRNVTRNREMVDITLHSSWTFLCNCAEAQNRISIKFPQSIVMGIEA